MLPDINGEFRVVADPELRFTPAGKAVASARIVANSRKKLDDGSWVDDKECWLNLTIWEQIAENFAESIQKGDLILVCGGRLETRGYETREGEKRQSYDVVASSVGPALRYATAKVSKVQRSEGSQQQGGGTQPQQGGQQASSAPAVDPWAAPNPTDEPPF